MSSFRATLALAALAWTLPWVPAALAQHPVSFGQQAPCSKAALAMKPRVDITTPSLNVRRQATAASRKLTSVQEGQQFDVLGFAPGQAIGGEEIWFLLKLGAGEIGWVSAAFVSPAVQRRLPAPDMETSNPELYARPGKRQRDGTLFWPYRFYWDSPVSNGGCPGFVNGDKAEFDADLADDQIRLLVQEYDVDVIISLACREHMTALVDRLGRHGKPVPEQESIRLWVNDKYYPRNRKTFLHLAKLAEDKRLYIHCRHGSHRAVVASMAALIGAGLAHSLGDALLRSRGHLGSFKPSYARPLFRHIVRFALEQGLEVEPRYLEFAGLPEEVEVSHGP